MRFMLNWLFTSIAIAIATFLVPGIQPFGFAEAWVCFAFVGLFLNIVDSFVKPFLTVISLPLTIITLGIFQLVLNSFMLDLASFLSINLLGVGISIASFGSAFMGSILVSIMRSILDKLIPLGDEVRFYPGHGMESTIGHETLYNPFVTEVLNNEINYK